MLLAGSGHRKEQAPELDQLTCDVDRNAQHCHISNPLRAHPPERLSLTDSKIPASKNDDTVTQGALSPRPVTGLGYVDRANDRNAICRGRRLASVQAGPVRRTPVFTVSAHYEVIT